MIKNSARIHSQIISELNELLIKIQNPSNDDNKLPNQVEYIIKYFSNLLKEINKYDEAI